MATVVHLPSCEHGCGLRTATLSFDVPARVEEIAPIVEQVIALSARELGEADDKHLQIGLALQEALANAVIHGAKSDASKKFQCWVATDPDKGVLIVVRDPGPGFDLSTMPDPRTTDGLSLDHGRGTFMIRRLMDEVHFERNGAEIHMSKK
jgi:serine/threonine-protein kinase RsbW